MAKSKLTDEVRSKIEEVAALDGTVDEMAYYCDVSRQTIYNYLDPESDFFDKKLAAKVEKLRARPILKARQAVVKSLDDHNSAYRYLERKARKEFSPNLDITTEGKQLPTPILHGILRDNSTSQDGEAE